MRLGTRKHQASYYTIKLLIMSCTQYLISLNQYCSMISNKLVFMRKLLMYPWLPGMKTVFMEKVIYSNSLCEAQSFRDIQPYEQQSRANSEKHKYPKLQNTNTFAKLYMSFFFGITSISVTNLIPAGSKIILNCLSL